MLSKPLVGTFEVGASQPHAGLAGAQASVAGDRLVRALFHIVGDADVGFIQRVVQPVAKVGAAPSRLIGSTEAGDGSLMSVDLRISSISETMARRIENHLRAIVGVHQVIAVYET